jgi:hypothetical protein
LTDVGRDPRSVWQIGLMDSTGQSDVWCCYNSASPEHPLAWMLRHCQVSSGQRQELPENRPRINAPAQGARTGPPTFACDACAAPTCTQAASAPRSKARSCARRRELETSDAGQSPTPRRRRDFHRAFAACTQGAVPRWTRVSVDRSPN